jgi:hypothetical protein
MSDVKLPADSDRRAREALLARGAFRAGCLDHIRSLHDEGEE